MILLDTSFLVAALTGTKREEAALRIAIERGEQMNIPSVVLYEWLRGPRTVEELLVQDDLVPSSEVIALGPTEAMVAASLYEQVDQPRSREIELAIAACAIVHGAELWTLNPRDFDDIPGLRVRVPTSDNVKP